MKTLTYGFAAPDLETVAEALEAALGIKWELHDSMVRGGDYFRYESGLENVRLQSNWNVIDGEPFEGDIEEIQVVLYASTDRPEELDRLVRATALPSPAKLLRESIWERKDSAGIEAARGKGITLTFIQSFEENATV